MSLDDELPKFLGGLYEAAHDRDRWRTALADVIRRSGSHMVVAASVDLRKEEYSAIQFHGPDDSKVETGIRELEGMRALDPSLNWAHDNPGAGLCETAAILPSRSHSGDEFMKWARSRFGTTHWRVFYTEPVDDLSFSVAYHTTADTGPPTREQLPLQKLLFENLERAVRLAARPPNFAADDSALVAADARGRPLSISQRADEILGSGDGLLIKGGLLTAQSTEAASLLQRAFRAAMEPSLKTSGRSVRIRRSSGKPDLLVVVSRFPPTLDHLPGPTPALLVRIVELGLRAEHLSDHSHLFDLTTRETQVASALLEGHSVNSMSEALGMSRNTARNHLQALFHKTRTNRQSDLLRMLDRFARQ